VIASRPLALAAVVAVVAVSTIVACRPAASPDAATTARPAASAAPSSSTVAVAEDPMVVDARGADTIPAPSDVGGPPSDAERSPSGLASKVLRAGRGGEHPGPHAKVTVHYTGWTIDGAMFDSSVVRGAPTSFPVDGVIPGFTEGLQRMVVGEQRRLWIPAMLAYGNRAGAPHGMLVFDVELESIEPR
jgi:peptidylprolyl isomerase